jgi:hypothetical protein
MASYELCYTSAPRGLVPGSQGFCTVKATRGIPLPLREALESLANYRHKYPPNHPNAEFNPVNFMHLVIQASGKSWHVVSRIQDAGLDHTNRSNFFAHHLAITDGDLVPAGPGWLVRQPALLSSMWDYQTGELNDRTSLPNAKEKPSICQSWQAVVGDAGWAGVVADRLLQTREPIYLVYDEKTSVMPLVGEVLALLPEAKRWTITFSTYFSSLPSTTECRLRCVLKGTPEETKAQKHGGAFVLDLTKPGLVPTENSAVVAARTGQFVGMAAGTTPVQATSCEAPVTFPLPSARKMASTATSVEPSGGTTGRRVPEPPSTVTSRYPAPLGPPPTFAAPASNAHAYAVGVPLGAVAGMILASAVLGFVAYKFYSQLNGVKQELASIQANRKELQDELDKREREEAKLKEALNDLREKSRTEKESLQTQLKDRQAEAKKSDADANTKIANLETQLTTLRAENEKPLKDNQTQSAGVQRPGAAVSARVPESNPQPMTAGAEGGIPPTVPAASPVPTENPIPNDPVPTTISLKLRIPDWNSASAESQIANQTSTEIPLPKEGKTLKLDPDAIALRLTPTSKTRIYNVGVVKSPTIAPPVARFQIVKINDETWKLQFQWDARSESRLEPGDFSKAQSELRKLKLIVTYTDGTEEEVDLSE